MMDDGNMVSAEHVERRQFSLVIDRSSFCFDVLDM